MKQQFEICSILPFWRWAVCPASGCAPGIPFYRRASAEAFFFQTINHLPESGVYLLQRGFGGVEVVASYEPLTTRGTSL